MFLFNPIIKKIISKNEELNNIYNGKTCYIFGNGFSLKFIDLKKFSNQKSFVCAWNYLHKDFNYLDVCADFHVHPGIFSPIWIHPYYKKLSFINKTNKFLIKSKRINERNRLFTSVANYPFLRKNKNIFYLHHFNQRDMNLEKIDPSKEYSLMFGSFFSMLGIAAYMGFKNIILVGMDYLSTQPRYGHFYEYGIRVEVQDMSAYIEKVKKIVSFFKKKQNIDIKFLQTNFSKCNFLENVNYEKYFNTKEHYKENNIIISESNLNSLNQIEFEYNIYEKK